MKAIWSLLGSALSVAALMAGEQQYRVLPAVTQGNLTVFPVVTGDTMADTKAFITLDEGIRAGEVVITETGGAQGLVRPRVETNDGVLRESWPRIPRPIPPVMPNASVNELSLINNSARPLLLLAGEIVTGGKQDRVVGKDRIIPAHSAPVALGVFCVEPHRWTEMSAQFKTLGSTMAQPSVRAKALFAQNQQEVWNEVERSRNSFVATLPAPAAAPVQQSSSYAVAMSSGAVQGEIDGVAKPIEQSFDALIQHLRAENAVGAVVALHGEIIWADVFASGDLLNRYWPKLVRSYAAESFGYARGVRFQKPPTVDDAQRFLDRVSGNHETVESEPGLYRQTEIQGDNYRTFILTSLLPGKAYMVHLAKMKE